ncbi:MAG: nucleotidyltransferase [Actinobacteria bacterium]|nr:MAG: nucleotidyltransferase [Actinomycetota bacterium]
MLKARLRYDGEALAKLCRKHHVRRLDLFGSRAKGTARDGSDVDLLVEFEPGCVPGLLGFIALQEELADLLGEEVDLVSKAGLSPYMKDEILASRSSLYEG